MTSITGNRSSRSSKLEDFSSFGKDHLSKIIEIFSKNNIQVQEIPTETVSKLNSDLSDYLAAASSSSGSKDSELENLESQFLTLLSDQRWSDAERTQVENIKSQLKDFFQKNKSFLKKGTDGQEYPLTTSIVEDLNYEAFLIVVHELKKDPELFQKQLVTVDNRDWNIYHWWINGLIQKASFSETVVKEDLFLLKEIDQILEEDFPSIKSKFLKADSYQPVKMLNRVYEIESSKYYEQIVEILKN